MSTGHVVVDGAMCKCKFGTTPDTLVVLTQQKEYINDSGGSKKLIANTMDIGMPLKAKTFGQCKLQPSSSGYLPCVPAITQWQDFYDKVILSNQGQILTEKSKAMCAISGSPSVEFTWHGQTAAAGSSSVEQANEEVQSQLNPLVNVKKMVESLDNDLEVEEENWVRNEEERVVSVTTDLYINNTEDLKTPFLDSTETIDHDSSKPFISGLRGIFGKGVKHTAIKEFKDNLTKGAVPPPEWQIEKSLSSTQVAYYKDKTIHLNEKWVLKAEKDTAANWILFRAMIEETGHYVEDLIRNEYDSLGGDAKGDEGTLFAADFIRYNKLLNKDFEYASFNIKGPDGSIREFKASVKKAYPSREEKAKDLLFIEDDNDDHGTVTLKSGEKIVVEFFKIRGQGAVHENITKQAAKKAGLKYDYRLDEGCAWPDVPCGDENSVETCYYATWRDEHKEGTMAYRSHHGDLQFWHSMAPAGDFTNQEVVDKIVDQAIKWYKKAISVKKANTDAKEKNYHGLFHMGKILHMVQDSFSDAHIIRDNLGRIKNIQSYNNQDAHKHGQSDAIDPKDWTWAQKYGPKKDGVSIYDANDDQVVKIKGAKDAINASYNILVYFKNNATEQTLENYLRMNIYKFAKDEKGKSFGTYKAGSVEKHYE